MLIKSLWREVTTLYMLIKRLWHEVTSKKFMAWSHHLIKIILFNLNVFNYIAKKKIILKSLGGAQSYEN